MPEAETTPILSPTKPPSNYAELTQAVISNTNYRDREKEKFAASDFLGRFWYRLREEWYAINYHKRQYKTEPPLLPPGALSALELTWKALAGLWQEKQRAENTEPKLQDKVTSADLVGIEVVFAQIQPFQLSKIMDPQRAVRSEVGLLQKELDILAQKKIATITMPGSPAEKKLQTEFADAFALTWKKWRSMSTRTQPGILLIPVPKKPYGN